MVNLIIERLKAMLKEHKKKSFVRMDWAIRDGYSKIPIIMFYKF